MNTPNKQKMPIDLTGIKINKEWTLTKALPRPGEVGAEDQTGSWFSMGYIASNGKKQAFVKIIDIGRALRSPGEMPLMDRLKSITDSHSFECSVLDICTRAKLDRVVTILDQGEIPALADDPLGIAIPYIMFELADGDVRKIISRSSKLDDVWILQVLHQIAVGLQQLHGQQIAHQDLKPSNVLIFESGNMGAKIGDLGRASKKGTEISHDQFKIAGNAKYAPPEQAYGITPERWEDRREGCDLYQLSGLITFLFSGITPTDYYLQRVSEEIRPKLWKGNGVCDYSTALPVLSSAFTSFVDTILKDLPHWCTDELATIILNTGNPDYTKRGDPNSRLKAGSPLGIETFISRFDRLAKQALIETRK